jgi:hypothetical protein
MRATNVAAEAMGEGTITERKDVRQHQAEHRYGEFEYECVVCVAKEEDITEEAALRRIKRTRTQKHVDRADRFSYARKHVQLMFTFSAELKVGAKQTMEQTRLSLRQLKDFFTPMMRIVQLKLIDEENGLLACNKYKAWEAAHPDAKDIDKGLQIDIELEFAMNKWRAFETKGDKQVEWCRAADYSDEWFKSGGDNGTYFATRFLCRSNKCDTLTSGKDWDMLHVDPLADKQRWYCPACGTRYKTTFGVVCELKLANTPKPVFCYASFPEQSWIDAKFSAVEESFANKGIQTAQELFDAIPKLMPLKGSQALRETFPGAFKFVGVEIEDLPVLDWFQLFNICGVPLPVKKPKGKKRGKQ